MKIRSGTIGKGTLPVLAAAFLCTGTQAQIISGGYTCSASFILTNNLSTTITLTNGTCSTPVQMAQWFDMSSEANGAKGLYTTLKCVDFSMWGTARTVDQLITVQVLQDLTPRASDNGCDGQVAGYNGAAEPGPDLASALLLGSEEVFILAGIDPATGPRLDGDFSVEFTGPQGGGILIEPDIAFFVSVGHAGEAITNFGANNSGELGDSTTGAPGGVTGGPEQTWVRPFNCTVGGSVCSQTGDWQKALLYYTGLDFVMLLHMDLNDTRDPLPLSFDCRQDIAPFEVDPETGVLTVIGDNAVNVTDLLALLGSWGQIAPPRPVGDIAPCPDPSTDCSGDNKVNVSDLLSLLAAWGPCPNLVKDCSTTLEVGNLVGQVNEGTFSWSIEDGLIDLNVARAGTDDLAVVMAGGVGICGWADYTQPGGPRNGTGTALGFIWGDAFGIFAGNFNTGGGTIDPPIVGGDVWFQYTADCNGRAFISATSSCAAGEVADTILEVYPGAACPTVWTEVLFCDDSSLNPPGCGDFGEVDFDVLVGEQYLIRIAGWFGEIGSGELNISCVDNSQCDAALPLIVDGGVTITGNTINAGLSNPPVCGPDQDFGGRWFSVIGDGNRLTASTCLTAAVEDAAGSPAPVLFDSVISVYCGTQGEVCGDINCVASSTEIPLCNLHDTVTWCTTFGQEYYILVHGLLVSDPPFFSEGFFILEVTTDLTPCAGALNCGVPRPFNDKCADAFELVGGPFEDDGSGNLVSTVNTPRLIEGDPPRHNNINALTDGPSPPPLCTFINQDVWYSYTPNFTSSVVVDTCFFLESPVNLDTAIEIYIAADAECPPVDAIGFIECQNGGDGTGGGRSCPGGSQYTTPVIIFAGQEILIRLGSNGGDKEGFYTLRVEATALVSQCPDPLLWNPCPTGGVLEGGDNGELLLVSPPYTTIEYSGLVNTIAVGDTVTGLTSEATGSVIALQTIAGVDIFMLDNVVEDAILMSPFLNGETITNGDPLLPDPINDGTATADVVTDFTEGFDITNGGCNMCAPDQLFDALTPGLVTDDTPPGSLVCGQISTYVSDADLDCDGSLDGVQYELRDTDWYTLTIPAVDDDFGDAGVILTQGGTVTITFASEFSASFGITEATCGLTPGDVVPFVASGLNGGLCSESTLVATLVAGDYYVVVTAFNLTGIAAGGTHEGHNYLLTVDPIAPGASFPTLNDECVDAITIGADSSQLVDQRGGATQNALDPRGSCIGGTTSSPIGSRHFANIWYKFNATHDTATVSACTFVSGFDSSLVIFKGGLGGEPCEDLTEVGCSDDNPGCFAFLSLANLTDLTVGIDYYVSIGAWSAGDTDVYQLDIISPSP